VGRIGSFIRSVTRDIRSDLLARVCQQSDDLAALLTGVCPINGGIAAKLAAAPYFLFRGLKLSLSRLRF
jgi:hypothetical protein